MRTLLLATSLWMAAAQTSPTDLNRVKPGDPAPTFELPGLEGKSYNLKDFRGKDVVLVFYRGHW